MMHRRRFLKWAGGALALPLLQVPGRATGQTASGYPTRLVIFYQPNGTKKELWSPHHSGTETRFEMGPLLAPLKSHRKTWSFSTDWT